MKQQSYNLYCQQIYRLYQQVQWLTFWHNLQQNHPTQTLSSVFRQLSCERKFANGAITGAFSRVFNDEKDFKKPKVIHKEVTIDPEFEGPIQWNVVDAINQGIENLGNALTVQGEVEAIKKFNSLELIYSPDGAFLDEDSPANSDIGGNRIVFGGATKNYLQQGAFVNYYGTRIRTGAVSAITYLVAHEFGHSIDSNKYRIGSYKGKYERYANNYAKSLNPFFKINGIDMSNISYPE